MIGVLREYKDNFRKYNVEEMWLRNVANKENEKNQLIYFEAVE